MPTSRDVINWAVAAVSVFLFTLIAYYSAISLNWLILTTEEFEAQRISIFDWTFWSSLAFWFVVLFVRYLGPIYVGLIVRLGAPISEIKAGPYLKLPYPIDQILKFSIEPHEERVGFTGGVDTEAGGGVAIDLYTKDKQYMLIKVIVLWQIQHPLKYFFNKQTAEDGQTIKGFVISAARAYAAGKPMEHVLENGKKELPDEIKKELVKNPLAVPPEEDKIFDLWGVQLIGTVRIIDLDPVPEIKENMRRAASAEYARQETVINAAAERKRREELAEALRAEGFAQAAIDAQKVMLEIQNQMAALGITDKDEAVKYDLAKKVADALARGNIKVTTLDIEGAIQRIFDTAIRGFRG